VVLVCVATQAFVYLSRRYAGQVDGLCGNFDGDSNDDFATLDNPTLFAARWKTASTCPDSRVPDDYEPCRVRTTYGQLSPASLRGRLIEYQLRLG